MGIETINNVVIVSAIHIHASILPQTPPTLEPRPYAAGPGSGAAFLLEDRYGSSSVQVLVGWSGLQRTEEPESWDKGVTLGIRVDILVRELQMEGLQGQRNESSLETFSTAWKPGGRGMWCFTRNISSISLGPGSAAEATLNSESILSLWGALPTLYQSAHLSPEHDQMLRGSGPWNTGVWEWSSGVTQAEQPGPARGQ